jgi:regulator of protease activity HflC (stomatin/prohibitin superfamily)
MTWLILLAIVAVVALLYVYIHTCVKVIRPYQKGLLEQLGKYKKTVDPSLRLMMPFVQRLEMVDMRECRVEVPRQEVITADTIVVAVDVVIYYVPTDPYRLVYTVADFRTALTELAETELRNVVGGMNLDEALTPMSRATMGDNLKACLADASEGWGVEVRRVEVQGVNPPSEVVYSMQQARKAEDEQRATIARAQGERQAAIALAEGERHAAIARAQGERQAAITRAEGEGAAKAVLEAIGNAAPDTALLTIKYLDALKTMAVQIMSDGEAPTIVVPTDLARIAGTLTVLADLLGGRDGQGVNGA